MTTLNCLIKELAEYALTDMTAKHNATKIQSKIALISLLPLLPPCTLEPTVWFMLTYIVSISCTMSSALKANENSGKVTEKVHYTSVVSRLPLLQ